MQYVSTRGQGGAKNFEEVLLAGLADDGGLYVPEKTPLFEQDKIASLRGMSYEEVAFEVVSPFVGGAFSEADLKALIGSAYASFRAPSRAPLCQLDEGLYLLELFHGPTRAFKDFAMQLIGKMFEAVLARRGARLTIVGATSGDTGAAACEAFRGVKGVELFILYPANGVSDIQRRQMTCVQDGNVQALAIDGTFDDCQAHVKAMFNDHDFRNKLHLSGVNSINWGRIMAQIVYYFTTACALGGGERAIDICVPSANFGDVYAGTVARKMGLPLARLGVATNQNDILHRCLEGGDYQPHKVCPSLSPSMDIQVSSNFERALFDAAQGDFAAVSALMEALKAKGKFTVPPPLRKRMGEIFFSGRVSEEETLAEIAHIHENYGKILCPHSAVGMRIGRKFQRKSVPMVVLATACPSKFPDAIEQAIGADNVYMPEDFERLKGADERRIALDNRLDEIKSHIAQKVGL